MSYILYKGGWIDKENICKAERLTKEQCKELLSKDGLFVRCVYNFDCDKETQFWYVIKDSFGGIEELSSKKRNQVRKSMKTYDFKIVPKEEIVEYGLEIANKALTHYSVRAKTMSQEQFQKDLEKECRTDYWMVYEKETGKRIAFGINTVFDEYCDYSTLKADPAYLNNTYPYYGLIYEMNRYYLEEKGLKFVCDGARSLTEHSNIQPFLIDTFYFRKAYCKIEIHYKWWLGIAVKMLYPFRKFIKHPRVAALMNQEEWSRS